MELFRKKLLYPFLFAVYPAIALLGNNIEEIKAETALRALATSLLAAIVLFLLLNLLLKDRPRAALITSLVFVAFFSYGHVYNLLRSYELWGFSLGRHRLLILDEPTDGFSRDQLFNLRELLLHEVGCDQVLVVSHEKEVEAFADYVYEITKVRGRSSVKTHF